MSLRRLPAGIGQAIPVCRFSPPVLPQPDFVTLFCSLEQGGNQV